jgi:two-component system invasion response regulator UvrY
MPKILIVDDHPVVAEGWDRIARLSGACEVLAARTPLAALRLYREARPDILVVDLSFGDNRTAGLKLISRLRRHDPETPVLVFSMHRSPIIARRALEAGCNGFVNKDAPTDEIHAAFCSVSRGDFYISAPIATQIALLNRPEPGRKALQLTTRETEILGLLSEGKSYREIGDAACISYKTVTNTCYALKAKLGAHSMPDLVVKAIEYFGKH